MPVELRLEFMFIVCLNRMNSKGKSAYDIVYNFNSALLLMSSIDLECTCSGSITIAVY
jgi:hypothetical protein